MHVLDPFLKGILQIPEIATNFTRCRCYFDSDYTSQDTFTALGSAYFIRQNIPIQQWNFTTSCFEYVMNRQISTGNLIHVQTVRKEKFPREFFSEAKWSRKGFTQTRWSINNFIFDMVNVHLFHDASNLLAVEQSPSIYSKFRKNALEFTLKCLPLNPSDADVPYAIFGDFNFRLDGHRLVQHIAEKRDGSIDKIKKKDSDELSKIIIKTAQNKTKLTIGKKEFNLHDDHDSFFTIDSQQFLTFDYEFSSFADQLFEYGKSFPPSYPYSEELEDAHSYLRVRCPAWCDRILLSHSFKKFVNIEIHQPTYNTIGDDVCMGDHKPVYLALTTHLTQGWSTSPSILITNMYACEELTTTSNNNNHNNHNHTNNQAKSPFTVMRKKDANMIPDLILNEVKLPSNDIDMYNIHDYAMFVQSTLVPQWWFAKLRQRPMKTVTTSSILWAKVRAVTFMTSLRHRTGSWYSDDQTEKSPIDDVSISSDTDDKNIKTNIELNDLQDYEKPHIDMPLRRSFSSNAYVTHDELYSTKLARSNSTTLINSSNHLADSPPIELSSTPSSSPSSPPPLPPLPSSSSSSLSPKSLSLPKSSSRVYRFLHCIIL
ncbi:unnamed protein product [Rotaria sp. Silwood1]|nr:unnamed protein product [Rotaria sp. Silwood1]CAF3457761.1 unnamed protein product [Rotaria sp. Silwood1]CAF3465248.1 unnamed protein product [Rotaria sp. Silwood1]CAF4856414.1 unnamed protein product [Rotaria sp. Silwood1]CAF4890882.1 unnamed protein product [Rotaria sp. Silwood1]